MFFDNFFRTTSFSFQVCKYLIIKSLPGRPHGVVLKVSTHTPAAAYDRNLLYIKFIVLYIYMCGDLQKD